MATIAQLLIVAEFYLNQVRGTGNSLKRIDSVENEIAVSRAASLLAIARSLNHIVDHGIGSGPLPMLSDEERDALDLKAKKERK